MPVLWKMGLECCLIIRLSAADGKNLLSVVKMVASGDSSMGETQIVPLICGAVKQLVQNRHKDIDDILVLALSRLAALKPEYFRCEVVRSVSKDTVHFHLAPSIAMYLFVSSGL